MGARSWLQSLSRLNDATPIEPVIFARSMDPKIFARSSTPAEKPRASGIVHARGAGMVVNVDSALTHAAVWACVRVICEPIATLGWHILRNAKDGTRERMVGTTADWLLNVQANPEMTAFSWRELALAQTLLTGNHYSEIQRDAVGRVVWIWPLNPESVQPDRDEDGNLVYKVWGQYQTHILPARDVIHIHGMGWDGLVGYSVIEMARRSIGSGLAMDEVGANFYANGTQLGLVLEHPGKLSVEAEKNLLASLNESHTGPTRSFKAIVAQEGMKLEQIGMSMIDAQFLGSIQHQVSNICRWFKVPPHKAADLSRATFSNIEHQAIEFVQDTILPWCKRLEQEIDIKLFGRAAQGIMQTRLNIDTLLRGDTVSQSAAHTAGRNGGWLSANDIRRDKGMNPIGEEGDIYLQPLNMVPAGTPPPPDPVLPPPEDETVKVSNLLRLVNAAQEQENA